MRSDGDAVIISKQIGVSSGTGENNTFPAKMVNKNPIIFYMIFCKAAQLKQCAIITGKQMLSAAFRQRFFPNNINQNFKESINIVTAFLHQLSIFFKLIREFKIEHWSNSKFLNRFFNRLMPFTGNFTACYISGLLHGCQSNIIKRRIFIIKRVILMRACCFILFFLMRENNNSCFTNRQIMRQFQGNLPVSWNFYCLGNGHVSHIA